MTDRVSNELLSFITDKTTTPTDDETYQDNQNKSLLFASSSSSCPLTSPPAPPPSPVASSYGATHRPKKQLVLAHPYNKNQIVLEKLALLADEIKQCRLLLQNQEDEQEKKICLGIGDFFKVYINQLRCKSFYNTKQCSDTGCELIHCSTDSSFFAKEIRKMLLSNGSLDNCDNLKRILNSHKPYTQRLSQLLLSIVNAFRVAPTTSPV